MLLKDLEDISHLINDIDELKIPIIEDEEEIYYKLRWPQRDALGAILDRIDQIEAAQNTGVTTSTQQANGKSKNLPPIKDAILVELSMRMGKTAIFSLVACQQIKKTNLPALYLHHGVASFDQVEESFRTTFKAAFGRDPIIWRFWSGAECDEGEPDLVMGTEQTFNAWERDYARAHPANDREFCFTTFDEAWGWATPTRSSLARSINSRIKLALTGSLQRLDDPRSGGHRIEALFNKAIYNFTLQQAFDEGVLNQPEIHLLGTNEGPSLHELLRGNYDPRKLNLHQTSWALNLEYLETFLKYYKSQDRPQTLFFCKTVAHLQQMQLLIDGLKDPDTVIRMFEEDEDRAELIPELLRILEDHSEIIEEIRSNDPEIIPIHSHLTPTRVKKNIEKFKENPDGTIGLAVDMLRNSITLKDLGLIITTGNTTSLQKYLNTTARAVDNNAIVVDVSQSVEILQQAMRNLPQYVPIWHLMQNYMKRGPQEVPLETMSLVERYMFLSEVIDIIPTPEEFLFGLNVVAFRMWMQRANKKTQTVSIKVPATVVTARGVEINLKFNEKTNVYKWLSELPIGIDGGLDLDPDQLALLEANGVPTNYRDIQDLIRRVQPNVLANGERNKEAQRLADRFFSSEDFWIGFETLAIMRSGGLATKEGKSGDLLAKRYDRQPDLFSLFLDPAELPKSVYGEIKFPTFFTPDGGFNDPRDVSTKQLNKFNMQVWYRNCQKHIANASDEVRLGCMQEYLFFNDPQTTVYLVENYLQPAPLDLVILSGSNAEPSDVFFQSTFVLPKDTKIQIPGSNETITTRSDSPIPWNVVFEAQALNKLFEEGFIDRKKVKDADAYLSSHYFSLGAHAYEEWIAKGVTDGSPIPPAGKVTIARGSKITLRYPGQPKGADAWGSAAKSLVAPTEIQFDLRKFYERSALASISVNEDFQAWLNEMGIQAKQPNEFELALAMGHALYKKTKEGAKEDDLIIESDKYIVFKKGARIELEDGSTFVVPIDFIKESNTLKASLSMNFAAYFDAAKNSYKLPSRVQQRFNLVFQSGYPLAQNTNNIATKLHLEIIKRWIESDEFDPNASRIPDTFSLKAGEDVELSEGLETKLPIDVSSELSLDVFREIVLRQLRSNVVFEESNAAVQNSLQEFLLNNKDRLREYVKGTNNSYYILDAYLIVENIFNRLNDAQQIAFIERSLRDFETPNLESSEPFPLGLEAISVKLLGREPTKIEYAAAYSRYCIYKSYGPDDKEFTQHIISNEPSNGESRWITFEPGAKIYLQDGSIAILDEEISFDFNDITITLRKVVDDYFENLYQGKTPTQNDTETFNFVRESGWQIVEDTTMIHEKLQYEIFKRWRKSPNYTNDISEIPSNFMLHKGEVFDLVDEPPQFTLPCDFPVQNLLNTIRGAVAQYALTHFGESSPTHELENGDKLLEFTHINRTAIRCISEEWTEQLSGLEVPLIIEGLIKDFDVETIIGVLEGGIEIFLADPPKTNFPTQFEVAVAYANACYKADNSDANELEFEFSAGFVSNGLEFTLVRKGLKIQLLDGREFTFEQDHIFEIEILKDCLQEVVEDFYLAKSYNEIPKTTFDRFAAVRSSGWEISSNYKGFNTKIELDIARRFVQSGRSLVNGDYPADLMVQAGDVFQVEGEPDFIARYQIYTTPWNELCPDICLLLNNTLKHNESLRNINPEIAVWLMKRSTAPFLNQEAGKSRLWENQSRSVADIAYFLASTDSEKLISALEEPETRGRLIIEDTTSRSNIRELSPGLMALESGQRPSGFDIDL